MNWELKIGDCLEQLKAMAPGTVRTCVTSPPYWGLRDYGVVGQLGLEKTPEDYVNRMVEVFKEVKRALADDGTLWLNLGDSYNSIGGHSKPEDGSRSQRLERQKMKGANVKGLKPKDLIGIPWRVALALQADGWYLRQDIIWHKSNPMPESVTDRCTKAHEYIFLLSKSAKYYFNAALIRENFADDRKGDPGKYKSSLKEHATPGGIHGKGVTGSGWDGGEERGGRNKRSVWTVATKPFSEAHFATYPVELIRPCILAGAPKGGMVLDPFTGSGTTGVAALQYGRRFVGIELNPEYAKMASRRLTDADAQTLLPLD